MIRPFKRHLDQPIRAWKQARLGDGFMFPFIFSRSGEHYGIEDRAHCRVSSHEAPNRWCRCGFYAWKAKALQNNRKRVPHSVCLSIDPYSAVLEVELYGRVIEHQLGYRAEYQRVLTIYITNRGKLESTRRAFPCDVQLLPTPLMYHALLAAERRR